MAGNAIALQPPKAYDLLAAQPVSSKGLSESEKSNIVVSAVADMDGSNHVLSRFGDPIWSMTARLPCMHGSSEACQARSLLWQWVSARPPLHQRFR